MQAWLRKAILDLTCFIALQLTAVVAHAQSTVKIGLIMTYTGQFTDAATQMPPTLLARADEVIE